VNERVGLLALALILAPGAAFPAEATSLAEQLRLCASEADSARRLNCYDRIAAGLQGPATAAAAPAPPAPAAPPPTAPASPASPASAPSTPTPPTPAPAADASSNPAEFGVSNGPLAAKRQTKSLKNISAVVTNVATRPRGELVVTLDNGQVWQQNEAVDYFPLHVGDAVEISSGALGSYVLSAPSRRYTKVTRIH
jgi:hypothetical protein